MNRRTPTRPFLATACILAGLIASATLFAQPAGLRVTRLDPDGQSFSDVPTTLSSDGPKVSPDGHWIVFWYDGDTDDVHDLWVASRFTGASRRISVPRPAGAFGSDVLDFAISADSRRVVFRIDQETVGRQELWSVPIDGTAAGATKISGTLDPGERVVRFSLSPNGAHALFWTDAGGEARLWTVPTDGSAPASRVDPAGNGTISSSGRFNGSDYFFHDNSSGRTEVYRVPFDGSAAAARVTGDLVAGGQVSTFNLSADGTRAVYLADAVTVDKFELWSVPTAGPTTSAVRLSPSLPTAGDVTTFRIVDDVARVLFTADSAIDDQIELWSAPLAGPSTAAVHLNVTLVAGGDVNAFDVVGDRVVYVADNAVDEQLQAFTVPIDGPFSASVRLHGNLGAGLDVLGVALLPRSPEPLALLVGHLRASDKLEIFVQDLAASGPPDSLFGALPAGDGYHSSCSATAPADLAWFAVCAALGSSGQVQLFRVDADFGTTPERLSNLVTVAGSNVVRVAGSPDARWAAYIADEGLDERFDLYRARTDGTGSSQRVHATPASALLDVVDDSVQFTPDSAGIVYGADHRLNGHVDLWISDAMIFGDGFELGASAQWSSTVP